MRVWFIMIFFSLFFWVSSMAAERQHRFSSLTSKEANIGREFRRIPLNHSNSSGWTWIDWEMIIEYADFFSEYEEAFIAPTYGYPYPFNSWNKLGTMSKIRVVELDTVKSISGDTVVGTYSTEDITILNSVGNPEENINSVWDTINSIWSKRFKDTFLYDDNENLTEICDFKWNSVDSLWENDKWKTNYFYNSAGNVVAVVDYLKDSVTGIFETAFVCSCYYDIDGNPSYILDRIGSPFFSKTTFTFHANDKLSEMVDYRWDIDSSLWKAEYSYTFSYNVLGHLVEEIQYEFDNDTAEEMDKEVWMYDANGLLIEELDYDWDADSGAWVCYFKNLLSYNGEGNIVEDACYRWDSDSNDWVFEKYYGKYVFHYTASGQPLVLNYLKYDILTGESTDEGYEVYCEYSNAINPWQSFSETSHSPLVRIKKSSRALVITVDKNARKGDVMKVYDLLGREIVALNPQRNNGKSLYQWNYRNGKGNTFANQVYIISIKSGDSHYRLKQVLVP